VSDSALFAFAQNVCNSALQVRIKAHALCLSNHHAILICKHVCINDHTRVPIRQGDPQALWVSNTTLQRWHRLGKVSCVRTVGQCRRYNVEDVRVLFQDQAPTTSSNANKKTICYARVSSDHQRGDLDRQVADLQQASGVGSVVIKDIASGLNWNRPGFRRLLEMAHSSEVWMD
jgi:DNA-binding transcriptional MerR regulator